MATTPTQPMDHPLGLSLNTWVSQHRASGHNVAYTMLSARCEDCGDWGPSKWAVEDDEHDDPQDVPTRLGRYGLLGRRLIAIAAVAVLGIMLALVATATPEDDQQDQDRRAVAAAARAIYPELHRAHSWDLYQYATATCSALEDGMTAAELQVWLADQPYEYLEIDTDPAVFARVYMHITRTTICPTEAL